MLNSLIPFEVSPRSTGVEQVSELLSSVEGTSSKDRDDKSPMANITHPTAHHHPIDNTLTSHTPTTFTANQLNLDFSKVNQSQSCTIDDLRLQINSNDRSSSSSFLMIHVNIRSLQKNLPKLLEFLSDINHTPELIAVSETWCDSSSFFKPSIPGYEFVCSSFSCNRAGGVGIFIKSSIEFSVRNDLTFTADKCENVWLEVKDIHKKTQIFGVIYRHPNHNYTGFQNCLEEIIFRLNSSKKPFYITGDLNIDFSEGVNNVFKNSIIGLGCQQFVKFPTRFNSRSNTFSIIDHLYSNQPGTNLETKVLIHDISDHFPIIAWIKSNPLAYHKSTNHVIRDMKTFNRDNFLRDLEVELSQFEMEGDANRVFESFNKTFMKVINSHAPLRKLTRRETKLKRRPWITSELLRSIRKKNHLYKKYIRSRRVEDRMAYKRFSNSLNHLKEKSKRKHYDDLLKTSTKNSKFTWKVINDIVNLNGQKGNGIKTVKDLEEGTEVTEPKEIAKTFNKYFVSIGQKLSQNFPSTQSTPPSFPPMYNSFYLKPFTVHEVSKHIQQLDSSKSVRPSDPPIKFIKLAEDIISPVLTQIFNYCVSTGLYPLDLKMACVIPIHKKGEKNNCGNYRPISLISPFSKIFEKCILTQLESFFNKHSIITNKQFGFRKKVSTEMALSSVYECFINNFENDLVTCAVFLDISKAFDSVNHKLLLEKLEKYGIRGLPHQLLRSYLSDRCQYTLIDGQKSSLLPICCGVPQGSVLGPFLFTTFINDLPNITIMDATLFADDACFSIGHTQLDVMEQIVNRELAEISEWFVQNKLSLNTEKTNFMLIHKKTHIPDITLQLNGTDLKKKEQIKYLGVTIDQKLNWKIHINNCILKLNKCLWAITKLRRYTSLSTLKLVYFALAYPHLQYCISTWGGACGTTLKPLLTKQKIIVKTMLHQPYMAPSSPLFYKLGMLKLNEIYEFSIGNLMFKYRNFDNTTMTPNLSTIPNIHSHNTRQNNDLNYYFHKANSNLGKTSFTYCGPNIWNTIPINIRTSSAYNFKLIYKKYLLQRYCTPALL